MSESLASIEPATGATLWTGAVGDPDAEVAAAREAWAGWASKPLAVRVETLRRIPNTLRRAKDGFADQLDVAVGQMRREIIGAKHRQHAVRLVAHRDARAHRALDAVVNKVDISVTAYSERTSQRRVEGAMGARVAVRHKPHGVLAVLGPYNFPAHLPNGHIVPALLAGNAIVFKPSEKTPAVGARLVALLHEAGVPEGVARCLIGGPDQGKALAAHPGIDGLLFTGSARAGLSLHRQFAEAPHKMLALELGGNNPLVVWEAADIHAAAVIAVQSAFLSAGQRCTAARRLIVENGKHEPLIEAIAKLTDRLIVDHPHANPAPFMGPVIDNPAADQLQEAYLDLVLNGGKPIAHLDRPDDKKPFLTPAVIDVTAVDKRPDAELFGPVLQVISVPDFDAALAEANATRYGLAASLVGGSPQL